MVPPFTASPLASPASNKQANFFKPSSSSSNPVSSVGFGSPSLKQPNSGDSIKVLCRFRPASDFEIEKSGSKGRGNLPIYDKDFTAVQIQQSLVGQVNTPSRYRLYCCTSPSVNQSINASAISHQTFLIQSLRSCNISLGCNIKRTPWNSSTKL